MGRVLTLNELVREAINKRPIRETAESICCPIYFLFISMINQLDIL